MDRRDFGNVRVGEFRPPEIQIPRGLPGMIILGIIGVALLAVFVPDKETCRDVKLVLGAVAPTPIRARQSERLAVGLKLDDALIQKVSTMAAEESRPITDIRSAASYRKTLVAVSTRRALEAARTWAQQGGS